MPDSLATYHKKRSFNKTPEPRGKVHKRAANIKPTFVIQKHDATRLHYDFRLEIDGVLKSWAVPKGPSLNPDDKRLAVRTEDHPIEYGGFEGVIPQGQYGGGTVLLWDRGTFENVGALEPLDAERKGHLKFRLHGKKLRGVFSLIRMGRDEKNWLLVKGDDEFASRKTDLTKSKPKSVKTGHTLDQVSRSHKVWQSRPRSQSRA
ncbi:MAG: hypothetical protein IT462_08825 [Planctomycetes bacterium]|nr:hypothetical protein [Planctomycetota bacterium]